MCKHTLLVNSEYALGDRRKIFDVEEIAYFVILVNSEWIESRISIEFASDSVAPARMQFFRPSNATRIRCTQRTDLNKRGVREQNNNAIQWRTQGEGGEDSPPPKSEKLL